MATTLENWSYRKFKKALDQQYALALANLTQDGLASVNWIRINEIEAAYREVWPTVSRYSADKTVSSLIGVSYIRADTWSSRVNTYISTSLKERLTDVWDTSKKEYIKVVNDAIATARDEGLGIKSTTKRIKDLVNGKLKGDINTWRARRIAHTETISALNYGTWQGQVEAVDSGANIVKQWVTYMDGKERPAHADANGQKREVGQPFDVGGEKLQFPGDPTGSAGNVINCRCNTQSAIATITQ